MSIGLTCISTDIRGCREIISDGMNGYLYKPEDVDALAALLSRCSKNVEERSTIGEQARATANSRFNEKVYVSKQVSAIERVLMEAGARTMPAPLSGR
jgi:glycosyltransferase involved in cell wall biosynthesis